MEGPFTLIVAILSIESSYLDEVERPVKDVPDTVQFWLTSASQWRIKTYAIDHDIHVHRLGGEQSATRLSVDFAKRNIEKTYGDVVSRMLVLEFSDPEDKEEVSKDFEANELIGDLESVKDGYFFLNPDSGEYRSKSRPH